MKTLRTSYGRMSAQTLALGQTTAHCGGRARRLGQVLAGLLVLTAGVGFTDVTYHRSPNPVNFAVISDTHLQSLRLGTSGEAFEAYLAQDPKLLKESEAILDSALAAVAAEKPRFLIIPGDLTKDGELVNHLLMAKKLAKLEAQGVKVFVVPGNHDINNPDAVAYQGATTCRVPNVNPRMFRAIYHQFGYGQAIAHDTHSLSYVAEPVRGVWLLAIDSCNYEHNAQLGYPVVGGRLLPETLAWVQGQLQQAKVHGKKVIAFMHHGVNQNYVPQSLIFPDYLLDDWAMVGAQLADAGLGVLFTGHYHTQDAAYPLDANGVPVPTLVEVETSSLAWYPCAYRVVTLQADDTLNIASRQVTEIKADTGGLPFPAYAANFAATRLAGPVTLRVQTMFGLPEEQAAQLAPLVVEVLMAQYAGDEAISSERYTQLVAWAQSGDPLFSQLGMLLLGMWTDVPPGDKNLVVPLSWN
jgi:hypothetical protein